MDELQIEYNKRKRYHIVCTILLLVLIVLKVVYYGYPFINGLLGEVAMFAIIGLSTHLVLYFAICCASVFKKDFDTFSEEELQRRDANFRRVANVAAIATSNPGLYQIEDSESRRIANGNGIHVGSRNWGGTGILISIIGVITNVFDSMILMCDENGILILLIILQLLVMIIFIIFNLKWNNSNMFIANRTRPVKASWIGMSILAVIAIIIGYIPFLIIL